MWVIYFPVMFMVISMMDFCSRTDIYQPSVYWGEPQSWLGSWIKQQLYVSCSLFVLFFFFFFKVRCGSTFNPELSVCYYIQRLRRMKFIRCSVKESGTPPEFWGPLGKLPTWCSSLCGCSSSGHHAWPYTCACKHTRRHTRLRFAMQ